MKYQIAIFMLIGCALARNADLDQLISNNAQAIVGNLKSSEQVDAQALNLVGAQRSITKRSPQEEEEEEEEGHHSFKELFEKIKGYLQKAWSQIKETSHKIVEELKGKGQNSEAESVEKTLKIAGSLEKNVDETLINEDDETKKNLLDVWQSFLDKLQAKFKEYQGNRKTTVSESRGLEDAGREADKLIEQLKEKWARIKVKGQQIIADLKQKNQKAKAVVLEKTLNFVESLQENMKQRLENEDNETRKNILESMQALLDKTQIKLQEYQ